MSLGNLAKIEAEQKELNNNYIYYEGYLNKSHE